MSGVMNFVREKRVKSVGTNQLKFDCVIMSLQHPEHPSIATNSFQSLLLQGLRNHATVMSANFAFPGDIIVALATPVSLAQFGARLFAYVGTKASLTTFRFAMKNSLLAACRDLPEEIISSIAAEVREQVFQQKIEDWDDLSRCLAGSCAANSILSDAELNKLCSMAPVDWFNEVEKDMPSWLLESVGFERNTHNLKLMCHFLTDTKDTSALAKCSQVRITPFHFLTIRLIYLFLDLCSGLWSPALFQSLQILPRRRRSARSRRGQCVLDSTTSQ